MKTMTRATVELTGVPKHQRKYHKAVVDLIRKNGDVTPHQIIEAAQLKSSPLHDYFDWSNRSAADKFRLWQARALLGQVKIRWTDSRGKSAKSRLTVNVWKTNGTNRRVYATVQEVADDVVLMKQVEDRALTDLRSWLARYAPYSVLSSLRKEVQKAIRNFLEG